MADHINPELLKQLQQCEGQPVQAVVQLRPVGAQKSAICAEETAALAEEVLNRVTRDIGMPPIKQNVLRNIGTVIVEAAPEFVHSLIKQPEVVAASPNITSASPVIPPHRKRPVE